MLISEFYENKDIFITGGSGFIGKALIEKLLRSCPGIRNIFVLVRVKSGHSAQERLDRVLKDPGFRRLWQEEPSVLRKIQPIQGDCLELGLGISTADLDRMRDVAVIIHSAATVRFDEPLRGAILMNARGTLELLKIATNLKNLKAFLHVSTSYCNPAEAIIEEKVYPSEVDWRKAIKLAETFDGETLNIFLPKIGNRHPNTYTFTKNLAELIALEHCDKVPLAIFRPSIVISSLKEPIPGWTDNINGPIGVLLVSGLGIKRAELCNPNIILSVIPCDIVVRSMIVAAYKIGTQESYRELTNSPEANSMLSVYNCVVSGKSPIRLGDFIRTGEKLIRTVPFEKTFWAPGGVMHNMKWIYLIQVMVLQVSVAIILDIVLRLKGHKPMFLKIQRTIVKTSKALNCFMYNDWTFKTEHFFGLENNVPKSEISKFGFLEQCYIDYDDYYPDIFRGIREFILKEPREPSSGALKRIKAFVVIHYVVKIIAILWLVRFIFRCLYI